MVGDERDQERDFVAFFLFLLTGRKENPVIIFSYSFGESCDLFTNITNITSIFYREIQWEEKHSTFQWHFGHLRKVKTAWANRKSQE